MFKLSTRVCPSRFVIMPPPTAPADPVRAIFEKLADEYKFSSKIVDKFMSLKLESLADFRFFEESESEIEKAFIEGIPDLEQPRLQLARVRHAWSACVAETKAGEARKMKEAEKADDEEFVLPPARIDEMKQAFSRGTTSASLRVSGLRTALFPRFGSSLTRDPWRFRIFGR